MLTHADHHHKKYTYVFLVLGATLFISALLTILTFYATGNLAAPPVTGSISFDEKIYYFAKTRQIKDVDVIAVGSSMTLNNLSSGVIEREVSRNFMNFSPWGLTTKQLAYLTEFLVPLYRPKIVITVTSPMDFYVSRRQTRFFDSNEISGYLNNKVVLNLYINHFDPLYLIKNAMDIKTQRTSNTLYQSVMFDDAGGVLLDIAAPDINKERWETRIEPNKLDPGAYDALSKLAILLRKQKITYVVVQPPLRRASIAGNEEALNAHWRKIESIARNTSLVFVNMHQALDLPDEFFVDYSHMNSKGATLFTQKFVELVKPTIGNALIRERD